VTPYVVRERKRGGFVVQERTCSMLDRVHATQLKSRKVAQVRQLTSVVARYGLCALAV